MADGVFSSAMDFLIRMGFLNTLIPFILYYAVVFGMLERTQIFTPSHKKGKPGPEITNLHSLIAFSVAITATAASQAVGITQNYLPVLSVTAVVLLGIMMLLGMAFGDKFSDVLDSKIYRGIAWVGAIVLIIGALVAVVYYSGMIVTPCTLGGDLTPVNSLKTTEGQCTKLIDISGFPDTIYVMGIKTSDLIPENIMDIVVGVGILVLAIIGVVWISKGASRNS